MLSERVDGSPFRWVSASVAERASSNTCWHRRRWPTARRGLGGAAEIAERIKGGCDAFTLVLAGF